MFEAQVAYYLNKYLGAYLEGIDPASLRISIYKGDVVLKNLKLKADALSELGLPIAVKAGLLGSLTLKVPWSALGQAPVEVQMDRLFLLARPQSDSERGVLRTPADVEAAFQSAKRQRVQQHESAWLAELERLEEARRQADGGGGGGGSFWGGGRLRGVIDTVIGNLQLSITNIHVRYEDELSHPGHPFSCGLTLERLAASTVDERGRDAFVTASPLSMLRKALDLRRAAVYFDTDTELWRPAGAAGDWHALDAAGWDAWFLPGVAGAGGAEGGSRAASPTKAPLPAALLEQGGTARHRAYVVRPVGGRAFYSRVGRLQTTEEREPRVAAALALDPIALRLSRSQYQSYQRLLAEVSGYAARRAFAAYRPGVRPAAGEPARAWWRYALRATQQQRQSRALSWAETVRFALVRRRYVALYAKHLRSKGARMLGLTDAERAELKACNDALPEPTLLMFRRLAHAEVQRERRREARAAAQQQQQQAAATGWVAWLTGRGGGGADAKGAATPTPEDPTMRADFTPEEFATLVDLVHDQEEGVVYGTSTPYTLLAQARVSISSASAELIDDVAGPASILRGALDGIAVDLKKYPETMAVGLSVAAMGLHSPEGVVARTGGNGKGRTRGGDSGATGGLPQEIADDTAAHSPSSAQSPSSTVPPHTQDSSASAHNNERWLLAMLGPAPDAGAQLPESAAPALSVTFVQSPQDGSADADVGAVLRPCFVYYSAATVERVTGFFRTPEALDFSNLQIAATGQLERARRAAAAYAAAAMRSRPKLSLRLQLDAPKIAVPVEDEEGALSLVLDLGQFVVRSDRDGGARHGLTPEQAALYEAVRVDGSDVQAFLVQGRHSWDDDDYGNEDDDEESDGGSVGDMEGVPKPSGARISSKNSTPSASSTPIPLLGRCGLSVSVQVSLFPDPDRPALRLQPVIPSLRFHLSPGRVRWLMRILNAAAPGGGGDAAPGGPALDEPALAALGAGPAPDDAPVRAGALRLLRWTGLGRTTESWQPVYASVSPKGRLTVYAEAPGGEAPAGAPLASQTLWGDRRVALLEPEHVHGIAHVVAITPLSVEPADALESSSAVLLRAEGEADALAWFKALCEAQQALRDLSGGAEVPPPEWDESSSVLSSDDSVALGRDVAALERRRAPRAAGAFAAPTTLLQLDAELGELALYVAGRVPLVWWPPEKEDPGAEREQEALARRGNPEFVPDDAANVEGEQQIVVVRATGGSLGFSYGVPGLRAHTVLEALEMEDLLVGPRNPRQRFLASSAPVAALRPGEDDLFFDADEDAAEDPDRASRASSGELGPRSPSVARSPSLARSASLASRGAGADLAEFTFAIARPGTAGYEGVDTSLDMRLGTLYFYVNRPTLAALMSAGTDLAAAVATRAAGGDAGGDAEADAADAPSPGSSPGHPSSAPPPEDLGRSSGLAVAQTAEHAVAEVLDQTAGPTAPLLGGAGDAGAPRTLFRMRITLGTLALALNYEGAGDQVLSRASVANFAFGLDILPLGVMRISAQLGDIQLRDATLPPDHPYHVACGLRSDRTSSLIDLQLSMFPPGVRSDPRAPPGVAWAHLVARLSQLQVVVLYRLLAEHLAYLNVMLAMRMDVGGALPLRAEGGAAEGAAPRPPPASPRRTRSESLPATPLAPRAPAPSAIPQQAAQQPFVLVLDVEMDAPVIVLPRNSESLDSLEIDLGELALHSRVTARADDKGDGKGTGGATGAPTSSSDAQGPAASHGALAALAGAAEGVPLMTERAELTFSGLSCVVVQAGKKGEDIFWKQREQGWRIGWRRPLQPERRGRQPAFDLGIDIPLMSVVVSNAEYARITSIAAANFAEKPDPPEGVQWLALHYEPVLNPPVGEAAKGTEPASGPPGSAERAPSLTTKTDASSVQVRVSLTLRRAELELRQLLEGVAEPQPLARFSIEGLWVCFSNTEGGSMGVSLCLPRVDGTDLRPEVPLTHNRVISSANKASFLMLRWQAGPGMADMRVGLTLQKPVFVAELSFLLALSRFVLPGLALTGSHPIPYASRDTLLDNKAAHVATADAWLTPATRLLADAPGSSSSGEFVYDGRGHRLILPPPSALDAPAPLILVGAGCTLRLRSVRVVHSDALATVLQLASGARLLAEPADDVTLVPGGAASQRELADALLPAPLREVPTAASKAMGAKLERQVASGAEGPAGDAAAADVEATPATSIEISVCAVGIGLELAKLDPRTGSVHLLAATMDLGAGVKLEGASKSGQVRLQGLHVESRYLGREDAAGDEEDADDDERRGRLTSTASSEVEVESPANTSSATSARSKKKRQKKKGSVDTLVLDPCRVKLDFDLTADRDSGAVTTDVRLGVSDVALNLSPDVVELAGSMIGGMLEPLSAPPAAQPLWSCSRFEKVWVYRSAAAPEDDAEAQALPATSLTAWRPRPRAGYLPLGDVLAPESEMPVFEALTVAAGSGLAAFPLRYEVVWEGAGATVWRGVPPRGYAVLGDVVTPAGAPAPLLTAYACVHKGALVATPRGQCLLLPPRLPHAPAAAAALRASVPSVRLWCCDNSVGTFFAQADAPRGGPAPPAPLPPSLDLRTPLGVHSAALIAMGAATFTPDETSGALSAARERAAALPGRVSPALDDRALYRRYLDEVRRSAREDVQRVLTPAVVDFVRIWSDDGARSGGRGVSFWRPVAPPGYASLGDCLVRGLEPPDQARVVRNLGLAHSPSSALAAPASGRARAAALASASGGRGRPLLWKPRGYELVWQDTSVREDARLTIWRPVPYPGYVAVGYLAGLGMRAPPDGSVACLRDDAAGKAALGRVPAWSLRPEDGGPPQLSAWLTDDATHTFVTINSALGRPGEAFSLKSVEDAEGGISRKSQDASESDRGSVNVVARIGRTSLLLRDALRVPLLELDLGAVEAGVQGPSQTVLQAYAGFSLSLWSYNVALRAWEPVVEPWQGVALCDANFGARERAGIAPGVRLSLKASSEMVVATLSYAAAASLLSAARDWSDLRAGAEADDEDEDEALSRLRGDSGAAAQHVLVHNALGIGAFMELDFGNRLEMVVLPAGKATRVLRPLPSFSPREWAPPPPETLPFDLLLLDVWGLDGEEREASGAGEKRETSGAGEIREASGAGEKRETSGAGEKRETSGAGEKREASGAGEKGSTAEPSASSQASGRQLFALVTCEDVGEDETLDIGAGARTCAVAPSAGDAGAWRVEWNERLVLALPLWARKRPVSIRVQVLDAADEDEPLGSVLFALPALEGVAERKPVSLLDSIKGLGTLRASWRLQTSRGRKALRERASPLQESAGDRALGIASQEGIWSVIPKTSGLGGREEGGKRLATPVRLGAETVVVEGGVRDGVRYETLRALCCVQNNTELTLEVALGRVEEAEWAEIPSRAGSVSAERSANTVVEEVFEHERWDAGQGWSFGNLRRGADPPRFLFGVRGEEVFPSPEPPAGWEWDGGWILDRGPAGDKEGWAYASAFEALHFPPPAGAYRPSSQDQVRARRWVRRRVRQGTALGEGLAPAHSLRRAGDDDGAPRVVGRVDPGESVPLPLGWDRGGSQLLLRPVLVEGTAPRHAWSRGGDRGEQALLLDCLDESTTRLVACEPLEGHAELPEEPAATNIDASTRAWFALTLEGDSLGGGAEAGAAARAVTDWRVVVSPPLTVINQLPVAGSLLVWEEDPARNQLVSRQTLRVRSGQGAPVHSADVRRPVSFSFYPDGYDWMEVAPALVTGGVASSRVGQKRRAPDLPDRVKVGRAGATRGVDVHVRREVELGRWLLRSREEVDPSAAAATGVPMKLTLSVPLWVVNATSLLVDVNVVSLGSGGQLSSSSSATNSFSAPQRSSSSSSRTNPSAGALSAASEGAKLRTLVTEASAAEAASDPPGARHVAAGSAELLSFPVPAAARPGTGPGASHGVRLRVAGSGWTPALALESVALGAGEAAADVDGLQPVRIRARVRASGRVHEVVARLEVSAGRACQVLRLEPYLVLSNRTPVPVTLLHCRALSLMALGPGSEGGVLSPAGAKIVAPSPRPGGGAGVPELAGPGPRLLRYDETATSDVQEKKDAGAGAQDKSGSTTSTSNLDAKFVPAPHHMLATGPLLSLPPSRDELLVEPGSTNVPLDLPLGAEKHAICFRCSETANDAAGELTTALWSRPFVVGKAAEDTQVIVAPLGARSDALLLRLSLVRRGPGTIQLVIESANADPPYCLENRTGVPLLYRQAYLPDSAHWHALPPLSAAGWCWEYTVAGVPFELELREALSEARTYDLDVDFLAGAAADEGGPARARAGARGATTEALPLSVAPHACSVSVGWMEQLQSSGTGSLRIGGDGPGGALGRGGVDRVVVLAPGSRGAGAPAGAHAASLDGVAAPRELAVRFECIELSLMDARPQELALLSLSEVALRLRQGPTPNGSYRAASLTLGGVQIDDQLPGTRFPVVLAPAKGQPADAAVLRAAVTQQVAAGRGRTFYPIVALHLPVVMQLAVGEPLIWRVYDMVESLRVAAGGGGAEAPGASGAAQPAAAHQLASADPHLHIRLLSVSDLRAQISFGADPLSRPRQISGSAIALALDLATFQAAPVALRGFELSDLSIQQSAFVSQVLQIVQGQLFSVGLSLVRNFGVIGGAGKVLGLLSASVARLAAPEDGPGGAPARPGAPAPAAAAPAEGKQISGMGDGLAEGFGAFGTGIMRGLRGVLQKPREGARQQGVAGAVRGLGRGLLGVVADPLSGALDALSATAQGVDATLSKSRDRLLELQRRRLPRVIAVDGRVVPLLKDNSARESRLESLGQALLQSTLIAAGRAPSALGERYEQHFVLPDARVVVLTDRAFFLLLAPGFDTLCAAADLGAIAVSEVGAAEVKWRVGWDDVLCLELRMSREQADAEPDRLVVHRKGRPGRQQEESLAHLVKCFPGTPQACQVKMVAQLILKRRYLDPIRSNALWSARHAGGAPAGSPAGPAALPADLPPASALPVQLPCLEFALMWHSNPQRAPVVSFWRPLPPAGYRPGADVVVQGLEPPATPVHCFRDDTAFLESRGAAGLVAGGSSAAGGNASQPSSSEPPLLRTARPREFSLLWRSNARRPVTIWLPVAPRGYVALGAVVIGAPEAPRPEDYVCLRADLVGPGRCAAAPLWRYDPVAAAAEAAIAAGQVPRGASGESFSGTAQSHHPETWRVSVWPVLPASGAQASPEGAASAFMAVRAFTQPTEGWLKVFNPQSEAAQEIHRALS